MRTKKEERIYKLKEKKERIDQKRIENTRTIREERTYGLGEKGEFLTQTLSLLIYLFIYYLVSTADSVAKMTCRRLLFEVLIITIEA